MTERLVSRREFFLGSALAGASLLLGGCAGSTSPTGEGSDVVEPVVIKKVLRFAQASPRQGLDMMKTTSSDSASVAGNVFESLLRWSETNTLEPVLLTKVPTFSEDMLTLACELKEDILFHDGTVLSAKDVKWSFERMMKPDIGSPSASLYDCIAGAKEMRANKAANLNEGITIEDDLHFTFHLSEPYAPFLGNLGLPYAPIYPREACKASGDTWGLGLNAIGTGPYKLIFNDDTNEADFVRNEDYHGGTPNLDDLRHLYIDDPARRLENFKDGALDYCDLPVDLLDEYASDSDVEDLIGFHPQPGVCFVCLNLKEGMGLEDVRLRKALSLAIDREKIVAECMHGAGTPSSALLAPMVPGFDPSAATFAHDPDAAKKLLEDAGITEVSLEARVESGVPEAVMALVKADWEKIGVAVNMQTQSFDAWARDCAKGSLQVYVDTWHPLSADGDDQLYPLLFSENAATISSFYNSADFDGLVKSARVEHDPSVRASLYRQADNLATRSDYALLPLFWPSSASVSRDYVVNAEVGNLVYSMANVDVDTTVEDYDPTV